MGHPAYRMGANYGAEEIIEDPEWGDGPEINELFQLIKTLHEEMLRRNMEIEKPIKSWQNFCSLATDVYDKNNASQ